MSFLARPSVVFAIIFGCFAVLVPRVFLPLFRSKSVSNTNNFEDRFRRPPPPVIRHDHGDNIEHIPGSPPHMRAAHPGMRMHHPAAGQGRQAGSTESTGSKSIVTLALPMYTVGIGVFFIYTCCKYWSKKNDDPKSKGRCTNKKMRWPDEQAKMNIDLLDQDSEEENADKMELYSGLDPEYVEYLKLKKQKALEAQSAMTEEQKQMHQALEEMKKSLSYISAKLVTKESRGSLDTSEISHLQERLATTESQMCQILAALDAASEKVNKLTKTTVEPVAATVEPDQIVQENENSANEDNDRSSSDSGSESDESEAASDVDNSMEQRSRSVSSSSFHSSPDEDQSIPILQSNNLIRRKPH